MEFDYLKRIFDLNNIGAVSDDSIHKLCALAELLTGFNEKVNVTAITDDTGIALRHFADCLTVLPYIPRGARVLDVGAGGGFPSLPLAVARSDIRVIALDSTEKKLSFIEHASSVLGISNISTLARRAEDAAHDRIHRERYDVVTARAVARLCVLCELCIPFLSDGGRFISMKGVSLSTELDESLPAIKILGGSLTGNIAAELRNDTEVINHSVVIIQKARPCPTIYPRNFSQISKKPLL